MRIAMALEYNGGGFCGWQRQPHSPSVQQNLEQAVSRVADEPVTVICAGRTDTGVHALAQVVHFDVSSVRPEKAWTFGVNTALDKRIAVHWAATVSEDFHARFSALDRSYRYIIHNRATRPGVATGLLSWVNQPLDENKMQRAANALLGEHDFSAFRSAHCQAGHPVRTLKSLQITRRGQHLYIDICANGFLHNMVRIIAGSLIKIGKGERAEDWMADLLAAGDRARAGMTAVPGGLYFVQPTYPDKFGVPDFSGYRLL